jgi:cytochrome c oxidase assembly protein subunit 15
MQFLTGLVNVVFTWPLAAAVLHNAGAAALVATLVVINYRLSTMSRFARSGDANAPTHAISAFRRAAS